MTMRRLIGEGALIVTLVVVYAGTLRLSGQAPGERRSAVAP
jgi:hypothetical protein